MCYFDKSSKFFERSLWLKQKHQLMGNKNKRSFPCVDIKGAKRGLSLIADQRQTKVIIIK